MREVRSPFSRPIVQALVKRLERTCARIEIAGSVRRQKVLVKDAEIVAVPTNSTYARLMEMIEKKEARPGRFGGDAGRGERYRQIEYEGLTVDLFFTEINSWGYIHALRTGPSEANMTLMNRLQRTPVRCQHGAVWYSGTNAWTRKGDEWDAPDMQQIALPNEHRWFQLFGYDDPPPPHLRDESLYNGRNPIEARLIRWLLPMPPRQVALF